MTYRLADTREIKKALAWLSKYWDRPTRPEYYHPRSINEAISLCNRFGKDARIFAGGIDVLGLMKNKVLSPRALVSIKGIPGLKDIKPDAGGVTLGSLATVNELEMSDLVRTRYPMLHETAASIASPQIRNMGTVGGDLCQEVRCWYYRRSPVTGIAFQCRRKEEAGQCYAADGENQYHAILGGCKCWGVCPSDLASSLMALDARINTVSTGGGRSLSVEELYAPLSNTLEVGEIITAVQVPAVSSQAKQRFMKFRVRNAIDYAIVSVASVAEVDNGIVRKTRIVLGGVTYKPYRATEAEEILNGEKITESLAVKAAEAAVSRMTPLAKNDYKVPILKALVKRCILE